ncbi:uncharacterized protein LOC119683340 [Teleopsis dalmanni]|uniref:uncharacterized protein LOC119683340 n=1 Tax=Teleopsis dalmanni TaxID=139649 RepID=UPI0018CE9795|nr:uncharacterized protein LOC119683340 [Teleopsis dalmanni]
MTLINADDVLKNVSQDLGIEEHEMKEPQLIEKNCLVQWQYMKNCQWLQYETVLNMNIEKAYKSGAEYVDMSARSNFAYIDFKRMVMVTGNFLTQVTVVKREEDKLKADIKILPPLSKFVKSGLALQVAHDIIDKSLTHLNNCFPGVVYSAQEKVSTCDSSSGSESSRSSNNTIDIEEPIQNNIVQCDTNELFNLMEILLYASEENANELSEETKSLLSVTKYEKQLLENITKYSDDTD